MKGCNDRLCNKHCVPFVWKILQWSGSLHENSISKHTYIYIIAHYNPSVGIIDLVSHTTYVVCVIFIHKWRDLQFKVDSEWQIFFWEIFHGNFISTLRVFARNQLRGDHRRNTFRNSFWCVAWDTNPDFSSNKPTHYLLDYGDLSISKPLIKYHSSPCQSSLSHQCRLLGYQVFCPEVLIWNSQNVCSIQKLIRKHIIWLLCK